MAKKKVVIGMLGTRLDSFKPESRWSRWRPTVSIFQHPGELEIDRMELLREVSFSDLAEQVLHDIREVSPVTKTQAHDFNLKNPWDFEEVYAHLYDFAESYPFDTENEEYLVHMTTGTHVMQICLFLLVESRHIPGRLIQTHPLPSFAVEGGYDIIDLDLSHYDQIAARFQSQTREGVHFLKSGIDTKNRHFNDLIEQVALVSVESSDPILLTGPTGSGKTRLARLIYEWRKQRRKVTGKFIETNCATLREAAAMSTLFGHVKGAYTGAIEDRAGLLKAADGGMLFLDEVGELGLDEQAMLLRAIEEKQFNPLGSDDVVTSDFQLICGTNRSLEEMVEKGTFRADLLARINLWSFELPGLADRPEDIEPNLQYELAENTRRRGKLVSFSKEAMTLFLKLAKSPEALWKGNFRDLSGAVTRMATLATGGRITEDHVRAEWHRLLKGWGGDRPPQQNADDESLLKEVLGDAVDNLDLFDKPQLACVIRECRRSDSISEAGRRLFANSRQLKKTNNDADRVRKYLARFGLNWKSINAHFSS